MRKYSHAFLLVGLVVVFLPSCSESAKTPKKPDNNNKTITQLIHHLKKSGLNVGKREVQFFAFIGASDGCQIPIGKTTVEVYKYDTDIPLQLELLKKFSTEGQEVMGKKWVGHRHGSFMIIDSAKHPELKKILEIFRKF